ncbi:TspO/MBR family protein [Paenibacillus glufosinatiresistens]|uniref:TspO/MBR family protein n=1 Tax=Paenibacillus glufosinatiresistens TaxID=3070657 RepID=UPI00286D9907|nr:TspO/MBR family protein [Paenibacillus sp. YX.27]
MNTAPQHMSRNSSYKWWNLLFYLGVLTVNILSVALPLGGRTTGEISDRYYTLVTPAGYAFSIWSVIYLLLGGFVLYAFRPAEGRPSPAERIGGWFIASCAFNMTWLLLWHALKIELAWIAIVLLLVSLIVIYNKTRVIEYPTAGERWLVKLPFSIYLGWLCVATIVNTAVVLEKNGWSGWGQPDSFWAAAVLTAGALLAAYIAWTRSDAVLPLVFVWAYIAIGLEHDDVRAVYLTAWIAAGVLLALSAWVFFRRGRDGRYRI